MTSNTDYRKGFKIGIAMNDLDKVSQRKSSAGPFGPPAVTEEDHKVDLHQVNILNWNVEGLEGV